MAEQDNSTEEKSEEPSAKKIDKAREDGNLPRSKELSAALITIASVSMLFFMGGWFMNNIVNIFKNSFEFDRKLVFADLNMASVFIEILGTALLYMSPIFILTFVVAIFSTTLTGGMNFTWNAMVPKFSKLNPLSGLKRIFGLQSLVELSKTLLKFFLVASIMTFLVIKYTDRITKLGAMSIETALASAGNMIGFAILIISLSLLIIAAIDVPYVLYDYYKKLKMTKKEVKDEMKDTEGRPEVKSHIRKRQREMASARMIEKVKDADVVITNPEHFSVAVAYEPSGENAPIVVAKGIDHLALRIRERAENNSIFLFEAPVLSRALYFTTDVNQQIPEQLYVAVAQVIAYVYNLNAVDKISSTPEKPFPQVPPELTFDSFGNVSN